MPIDFCCNSSVTINNERCSFEHILCSRLTKTYGRINYVFISSSEGLLEISFASTLLALLNKRLTNDNSFKEQRSGGLLKGWPEFCEWVTSTEQQNLCWLVRCTHDSMFARSSNMLSLLLS